MRRQAGVAASAGRGLACSCPLLSASLHSPPCPFPRANRGRVGAVASRQLPPRPGPGPSRPFAGLSDQCRTSYDVWMGAQSLGMVTRGCLVVPCWRQQPCTNSPERRSSAAVLTSAKLRACHRNVTGQLRAAGGGPAGGGVGGLAAAGGRSSARVCPACSPATGSQHTEASG